MDRLLLCDGCSHEAIAHAAAGCEITNCACEASRELIVECALRLAADDIHNQYRTSPHSPE
jgi:hypothetical protein